MLSRLQGAGVDLTMASDGFFLNLSWILLSLSEPFSSLDPSGGNPRLMRIDPAYCSMCPGEGRRSQGDAPPPDMIIDFSTETKLAEVFKDSEGTCICTCIHICTVTVIVVQCTLSTYIAFYRLWCILCFYLFNLFDMG